MTLRNITILKKYKTPLETPGLPLLVYHRTGFEKGEAGSGRGGRGQEGRGGGGGGAVQHRHPGQVHHAVKLGPLLQHVGSVVRYWNCSNTKIKKVFFRKLDKQNKLNCLGTGTFIGNLSLQN